MLLQQCFQKCPFITNNSEYCLSQNLILSVPFRYLAPNTHTLSFSLSHRHTHTRAHLFNIFSHCIGTYVSLLFLPVNKRKVKLHTFQRKNQQISIAHYAACTYSNIIILIQEEDERHSGSICLII